MTDPLTPEERLAGLVATQLQTSRELNGCAEIMGARDFCCSYHDGYEDALLSVLVDGLFGRVEALEAELDLLRRQATAKGES